MTDAFWARTEAGPWRRATLVLIGVAFVLRIAFAATTGLGVDESYLAATSRFLALSTYDHPPLAWWITWLSTHLLGSESPVAVRLPFVVIFAFTTWQMFRLGALLLSPRAGFLSALILNCAPVLGVTSATWALPDGPLLAALVSGSLYLGRVLLVPNERPVLWLGAGFWSGIALLSKYHGVFLIAGTGLFLLTSASQRRWLGSPWPYAGAAVAVIMFSPVIIWNAQHGWVSFAFQGGRAVGDGMHPWMPIVTLAGQALFMFPIVWCGLIFSAGHALRDGPNDAPRWLLLCLGIGPIALFTVAAAWSRNLYFHWAAPGYLMWIPLLARDLEQRLAQPSHIWRRTVAATAMFIAAAVVAVSVVGAAHADFGHGDPLRDLRDWTELARILKARGLAERGIFVAAVRWSEAGRLDYALGGHVRVTCLCEDARGYGIIAPARTFVGQDAVILVPPKMVADREGKLKIAFERLERLEDITIRDGKRPITTFAVYFGTRLK